MTSCGIFWATVQLSKIKFNYKVDMANSTE